VLIAMRAGVQPSNAPVTAPTKWQLAALAAAVLLAINFSMSVANDADFHLQARTERASVTATAAELRRLAPELSEDEALRHALVLWAGAATVAAPEPAAWMAGHLPEMEPK